MWGRKPRNKSSFKIKQWGSTSNVKGRLFQQLWSTNRKSSVPPQLLLWPPGAAEYLTWGTEQEFRGAGQGQTSDQKSRASKLKNNLTINCDWHSFHNLKLLSDFRGMYYPNVRMLTLQGARWKFSQVILTSQTQAGNWSFLSISQINTLTLRLKNNHRQHEAR